MGSGGRAARLREGAGRSTSPVQQQRAIPVLVASRDRGFRWTSYLVGPETLPSPLRPEIIKRLIRDREWSALQLLLLPLLEPAHSDFVGQGSTRPKQVGKAVRARRRRVSTRP